MWSLSGSQLNKLEGLQRWFVRRVLLLPKCSSNFPIPLNVQSFCQLKAKSIARDHQVITRDRQGLIRDSFMKPLRSCLVDTNSMSGFNFSLIYWLY